MKFQTIVLKDYSVLYHVGYRKVHLLIMSNDEIVYHDTQPKTSLVNSGVPIRKYVTQWAQYVINGWKVQITYTEE